MEKEPETDLQVDSSGGQQNTLYNAQSNELTVWDR